MRTATSIKIESGKPIPPRKPGIKSPWEDAINAMNPGDSFTVETNASRCNVMSFADRHGHKVVSRKIHGEGFRIWMLRKAEVPS